MRETAHNRTILKVRQVRNPHLGKSARVRQCLEVARPPPWHFPVFTFRSPGREEAGDAGARHQPGCAVASRRGRTTSSPWGTATAGTKPGVRSLSRILHNRTTQREASSEQRPVHEISAPSVAGRSSGPDFIRALETVGLHGWGTGAASGASGPRISVSPKSWAGCCVLVTPSAVSVTVLLQGCCTVSVVMVNDVIQRLSVKGYLINSVFI